MSRSLLAISILCLMPALALAQWKGETVVEDGVTHVHNPAESMLAPITITPRELWRVGGDDDEIFFGVIARILEDDAGELYVLDGQLMQIQVYSPTGEHLRTLGRQGEGPGEFQSAFDMFLGPGGVLGVAQVFPGKIVQITTEGDPAGNFPLPEPEGGGFQLVFWTRGADDRVVTGIAVQKNDGNQQIQVDRLDAYDPQGKLLARYHEESHETRFGGMKFDERTFSNFQGRWVLTPQKKVVCAVDFDDYALHVWNPDGTLDRIVHRATTPLERTGTEKKRMQRLYDGITRWNPGSTFAVSDTHPAVVQMAARDDGTLWVVSSRGAYAQEDGIFASFDVFDDEGRFVREVRLQCDGDAFEDAIYFLGDRLYVVTDSMSATLNAIGTGGDEELEEEPQPMQVICYELDVSQLAAR